MKKALALALVIQLAVMPMENWAQSPPVPASQPASAAPHLSADELAKLVGPIALYPDPMISLILPASTVPTDIVMAARFLRDNKDASQIDSQNWDPSVKGLAHYPDVINMMNENLDWTNQLGAAVIAQQADVMSAIQAQRAKAKDLGNLQTTPQQKVIVEKDIIQVVPADPQVIYVPTYNPDVVYVQSSPPAAPFLAFGAGLALGAWIGGGCDWYHNGIYTNGCWGPGGWNNVNINNNININNNNFNNWRPNGNRPPPHPPYNPNRPGGGGGGQQFPGFKPAPPGGWSGGNNRPGGGGNNPSFRPGGNTGQGGNGNRPGGNGGGKNPNFKPGGNTGGVRPGAGGSGTYKGGNNPANERSPSSKKSTPSTQRPGADTPQRKVPDFNGGSNQFQQHGSKFSRPGGGGERQASRPARGGGGGGRFHR